jgi:hypothetical protein
MSIKYFGCSWHIWVNFFPKQKIFPKVSSRASGMRVKAAMAIFLIVRIKTKKMFKISKLNLKKF